MVVRLEVKVDEKSGETPSDVAMRAKRLLCGRDDDAFGEVSIPKWLDLGDDDD